MLETPASQSEPERVRRTLGAVVKAECLSKLILFAESSLQRALTEFVVRYHSERNHQGKDNVLLLPAPNPLKPGRRSGIHCRERLGGLLRYYSRAA